ncbi:uncharacterized protein DSM5745_09804 [Aspergillus mulundensis]|uniref:Uncharacterized protein n=1 Tax=Aspergillus mulundensis TaxID=1810919 RepID=A0A3D8QRE8_9EURO|nr:hypothetical protein DSM5745_09804 [Aspergillus mulundensis]RDW64393.1 hypothetical protein DSM5745_09804 [Aspergillus mulundensis]
MPEPIQPFPLNPDIWHLIFNTTTQNDLLNIARTCRTFNTIATPLLYRSITLLTPKPTTPDQKTKLLSKRTAERQRAGDPSNPNRTREYDRARWTLFARLERDEHIRSYVREVVFPSSSSWTGYVGYLREDNYDRLCRLLLRLPNLRRVKLGCKKVQKECGALVRAIAAHPRQPELEVTICETDKRGEFPFAQAVSAPTAGAEVQDSGLSCVSSLTVTVEPHRWPNGGGRRMRDIQDLFFRCPRLRCFAMTVRNAEGGHIFIQVGMEMYGAVSSFKFGGSHGDGDGDASRRLVFPPLEELSLDGYQMDAVECAYWRDGLDWSRLKSLTVGPNETYARYEQDEGGLLGKFAGYATSLTTLRVLDYAGTNIGYGKAWVIGPTGEWRDGLARLLDSFDSLVTLELRGYWPSRVETIWRHRGLRELTLHVDEVADSDERRVLSVEELEFLDERCPGLRVLEIDIERDGELPITILTTLATRFKSLHVLSLHFELGLRNIKTPLRPSLSTINAHRLGKLFFNARHHAGIATSCSFTITLWTGRSYPCEGEPERDHTRFADEYTATYSVSLADGGDGDSEALLEVRRVEGKSLDIREMAVNPSGIFRG